MASAKAVPSDSVSSDGLSEEEPDWLLARRGIDLLLNNQYDAANAVFLQNSNSLGLYAGYAISLFMDALMTLEDDKFTLAISTLKDLERKCTTENNSGWLKTIKFRVFGNATDEEDTLEQIFEAQIVHADALVCIAILTFMQQDITGYIKGSWILRRAWKIYQKVHQEIREIYEKCIGEFQLPDIEGIPIPKEVAITPSCTKSNSSLNSDNCIPNTDTSDPCNDKERNGYIKAKIPNSKSVTFGAAPVLTSNNNSTFTSQESPKNFFMKSYSASQKSSLKKSSSVNSALSNGVKKYNGWNRYSPFSSSISIAYFTSFNLFSSNDELQSSSAIDKETVKRLMSAVCFGYGLFQLGISLLPPSLLKFTNLLGFNASRYGGISHLMFSRLGSDMRAPLASLSLLWYYTIVRPFYALDGSNIQAGVNYAKQLIDEAQNYKDSALFLFFKGRVARLQSDIPEAIRAYQTTATVAKREIRNLALHEVGWCYLIQLDLPAAEATFLELRVLSRWSRQFYLYLSTICRGGYGDCRILAEEFRRSMQGAKVTQLDEFLEKRVRCVVGEEVTETWWRLLVYEMLYLWNALASCNGEGVKKVIEDCHTYTLNDNCKEPMKGLSRLILGACYSIQDKTDVAIEYFREGLLMRKDMLPNAPDAHVSAFLQYELGSLLIKSSETKLEGTRLLQGISAYKGYDFEQRLNVRVHSLLRNA